MTDRELMQQAHDALLNFEHDISDEMFAVLTALRARLAQEPPCKTGSQCIGGKCLRCAEPEPVVYLTSALGHEWVFTTKRINQYSQPVYYAQIGRAHV